MKKILILFFTVSLLLSCNLFINLDEEAGNGSIDKLKMNALDEQGWTLIPPLADDAIQIYVSSSEGSDENDGLSQDSPLASISAGYDLLRKGYPDRLLLKCGDQWDETITLRVSGRSSREPVIISSYGTGDRPQLSDGGGMRTSWHYDLEHCWIIGLDFYNPYIDPESEQYIDPETAGYNTDELPIPSGNLSITGGGDQIVSDLLLEDCSFRFKSVVIQLFEGDEISNIRIRRCIISDNYSAGSGHSQGIYMSHIEGLLIEETLFDHNGWLNQGGTGEDMIGEATMFNHNIYITGCDQVVYRGNLFLRGASMGNKFRSDVMYDSIDILLDNNFYYGGELGASIGGNTDIARRFVSVRVINNVFSQIGIDNPTSRNFSWGLGLVDVFKGLVSHNCFLDQPWYGNSHALSISGFSTREIEVEENLFYNINGYSLSLTHYSDWRDIEFTENLIDSANQSFGQVRLNEGNGQVQFLNNRYFSSLEESFRLANKNMNFQDWQNLIGDRGRFTLGTASYPDAGRNIESYDASLGGDGSFEHFLENARAQRKGHWNSDYTAPAINDYIRAGYGWETLN